MTNIGTRTATAALGLLLTGALAAGCGASHVAQPATTLQTPTTVAVSPQQSGAAVAAAASTALAAVDGQLKSLNTELGTADAGLSAQEGDPTK